MRFKPVDEVYKQAKAMGFRVNDDYMVERTDVITYHFDRFNTQGPYIHEPPINMPGIKHPAELIISGVFGGEQLTVKFAHTVPCFEVFGRSIYASSDNQHDGEAWYDAVIDLICEED